MDIISLIIIIAIIKKVIEKNKEKDKKGRKQSQNISGEWVQQRINDFANATPQQRQKVYADTVAQLREKGYVDTVAQQRATKERLERKYGKAASQTSYQKASKPQTDILSRAKTNVKEESADKFKQQAHAEVCSEYRSHAKTSPDLQAHKGHSPECDFEGESDILKRVNDLMIMGYDGALEFDRDFIAEGVEMLNSFSL